MDEGDNYEMMDQKSDEGICKNKNDKKTEGVREREGQKNEKDERKGIACVQGVLVTQSDRRRREKKHE